MDEENYFPAFLRPARKEINELRNVNKISKKRDKYIKKHDKKNSKKRDKYSKKREKIVRKEIQ